MKMKKVFLIQFGGKNSYYNGESFYELHKKQPKFYENEDQALSALTQLIPNLILNIPIIIVPVYVRV